MISEVQKNLLQEIAGIHEVPMGAYSLRINGSLYGKNDSEHISIVKKTDKPGIEIYIKPGTKNESVHIPVLISETGLNDMVYNDFFVGEDCDVTIVAGCGIHNCGTQESRHDGMHTQTIVYQEEDSHMEMETAQIRGIDSTVRSTTAKLGDGATLVIHEKILTHGHQLAETHFVVDLDGVGCGTHVVSRSVAKEDSHQKFFSNVRGNNRCSGHTECDAIIMDRATVAAIPEIEARHTDASLIHEAAIGKIAGEQLIKLMTLGLTEKEAEEQIINGFLK